MVLMINLIVSLVIRHIPLNQEVEDKVLSEPNNALFSGIEGLDSYKAILSHVNNYLNDKAIIAFEHGYDQKIS